jgi:hypothetical protein
MPPDSWCTEEGTAHAGEETGLITRLGAGGIILRTREGVNHGRVGGEVTMRVGGWGGSTTGEDLTLSC